MFIFIFLCTGRRRIRTSFNTGIKCLAVNRMDNKLAMGLNGNNKPMVLDIETYVILQSLEKLP